jgi:uncharacterized caspase-like protein
LAKTEKVNLSAKQELEREMTLDLDRPPSVVCLQAWNKYAPSGLERKELVSTRFSAAANGEAKPARPRLWIVSIGIGKFTHAETDGRYHLQYAAADADEFANAMQSQAGAYADVRVKLLKDANASEIRDGFDWLRSGMAENDVAMIFMAGHGTEDAARNYYFLASDYDPDHLSNTTVRFGELLDVIGNLRSKGMVFAFIDTCHAAKSLQAIDSTGLYLKFSAPEVGAITFFACSANQLALEGPAWGGHGAFTYYLTKGLRGKAARPDGTITPAGLGEYVSSQFDGDSRLKGVQTPCMQTVASMPLDFPISRVKRE